MSTTVKVGQVWKTSHPCGTRHVRVVDVDEPNDKACYVTSTPDGTRTSERWHEIGLPGLARRYQLVKDVEPSHEELAASAAPVVERGQVWARTHPSFKGKHLRVEEVRGSYVYSTPCDPMGKIDERFVPYSSVLRRASLVDGSVAHLVWGAKDGQTDVPDPAELHPVIAKRLADSFAQGEALAIGTTAVERVRAFAEAHASRRAANGVDPQVVSRWVTVVDDEEVAYELTVADLLHVTAPRPVSVLDKARAQVPLARLIASVGEPDFGPDDAPSSHDREVAGALIDAGYHTAPTQPELVDETPSVFEGAPPVRTYSDGSQQYGPYASQVDGSLSRHCYRWLATRPPQVGDVVRVEYHFGHREHPQGWLLPRARVLATDVHDRDGRWLKVLPEGGDGQWVLVDPACATVIDRPAPAGAPEFDDVHPQGGR